MVKMVCGLLVTLASVVAGASVEATAKPSTYAAADFGYRWDKVDDRETLFNDTGDGDSSGGFLIINRLNTFQLGGRAQWALPCTSFFVRGSGHYGWTGKGDLQQLVGTDDEEAFEIFGSVSGHNVDGYGTAGYLFPFHPCWSFGPIVGYAYDRMKLKSKSIYLVSRVFGVLPSGTATFEQKFQGPFVGLDLLIQGGRCWRIEAEWKLIRGWWKYSEVYDGVPPTDEIPPIQRANSTRNLPRVWGNRFALDMVFLFCRCWAIGLDAAYETRVNQGSGSYRRDGLPARLNKREIASFVWQSFCATLHVGYEF